MTLQELLVQLGPGAEDRVRQGFARKTQLNPMQELLYRHEMQQKGLGHMIDDPTYDTRGMWLRGGLPDRTKDPTVHMESTFKGLGDDRLMLHVNPKTMQEDPASPLVDTRTMQQPNPQLTNLWKLISGIMNK
jgi:hypothetical protein